MGLALGLYLGGNMGGGAPPTPSAPVFASEPGTLDTLDEAGVLTLFGFVPASGYPTPTYVLDGTYPSNVQIVVGGNQVTLPASLTVAQVSGAGYVATGYGSGTILVTLTGSNGVSPDAEADASVNVDVDPPAPEWSPGSYSLELPISDPISFGGDLIASNTTTIKVIALPDKGTFYLDDGDDTPLAVNDEFPIADLDTLTGESDGDSGAVTGPLTLQAIGDGGTTNFSITVSISSLTPSITSRTLNIERGQAVSLGLDTTNWKVGEPGDLANDSDATLTYEDFSA